MTDYIKREDAIKEVGEYIYRSQRRNHQPTDFDTTYILLHIPSADVAPVRHGRWVVIDAEEPRRYGCSECKRLSWYMENYCPNCGAKMDE